MIKNILAILIATLLVACNGAGPTSPTCIEDDGGIDVPDGTIIVYPDASTNPYAIGPERVLYDDAVEFCAQLGGHIIDFDDGGEWQAFFTNAYPIAAPGVPIWTSQPFRLTNGHDATYVLIGAGQQLPVDLTAWGEETFTARPYCELE